MDLALSFLRHRERPRLHEAQAHEVSINAKRDTRRTPFTAKRETRETLRDLNSRLHAGLLASASNLAAASYPRLSDLSCQISICARIVNRFVSRVEQREEPKNTPRVAEKIHGGGPGTCVSGLCEAGIFEMRSDLRSGGRRKRVFARAKTRKINRDSGGRGGRPGAELIK